jgi:hypothetical protein
MRIAGLLLVFLALLLVPAGRGFAQSQAVIYTQPSPINIGVGQTVTVTVWVEDASTVYSYFLRIYFNPAILQIQDADLSLPGVQVKDGDFFYKPQSITTSNWVDNSSGVVTYINSFIDPTMSVSGSGKLISFELQAVALGTGASTISLSQSYLISPQGDILPVSVLNPQVYTSTSAVPTVTTPSSGPTAIPTATATGSPPPSATPTVTPQGQVAQPATSTPPGGLPTSLTPASAQVTGTPDAFLPLVSNDSPSTEAGDQPATPTEGAAQLAATQPAAAFTPTPPPLPTALSYGLAPAPLAPPPAQAQPGLFEGIGLGAWIAVILAVLWLLVLAGYLIYRFVFRRSDELQ